MLSPGTLFREHYKIHHRIGSGGMGIVYEVEDTRTERRMALKLMLPGLMSDRDSRRRFEQEATILARVDSEHLVQITDAGVDEQTECPFLVMDLLKGEELAEVLKRDGPFSFLEALSLLKQLANTLEKTHARGIVHRDIKPENIFLTRDDAGEIRIKILDFGIAKLAQPSQGQTTLSMGTPYYMAPEQIRGDGDLDERADNYSVAQLAFSLLVARPYFQIICGENVPAHVLLQRASLGTNIAPSHIAAREGIELPSGFDSWFQRATHRSPARRFISIRETIKELSVDTTALNQRFALGRFKLHKRPGVWALAFALCALILVVFLVDPGPHERLAAEPKPPQPIHQSPSIALEDFLEPRRLSRLVQGASVLKTDVNQSSHSSSPQFVAKKNTHRGTPFLPSNLGQNASSGGAATVQKMRKSVDCDVPFFINERGVKHFREECLSIALAVSPGEKGQVSEKTLQRAPPMSCDPPYEIDDKGIKRFHRACLGVVASTREIAIK